MCFDFIGKTVRVNGGVYSGETGTVTKVFPAGMYDTCVVFMVKYSGNPNSGMFPERDVEFVD